MNNATSLEWDATCHVDGMQTALSSTVGSTEHPALETKEPRLPANHDKYSKQQPTIQQPQQQTTQRIHEFLYIPFL